MTVTARTRPGPADRADLVPGAEPHLPPQAPGKVGSLTTGHLHQVDLVRLLTFSAVIAVHSIAFAEPPSSGAAGAELMLLQFGRAVFFALTAFVLVHSARKVAEGALAFWRRRFLYVAVPYAAWTVIYEVTAAGRGRLSLTTLGADLLTGGAEYHLYFLLVTMQLYLVFPWLLRFLRATQTRAWTVLAAVGVANLAWFAAVQYQPAPSGWGRFLWDHAYALLPSYALYVLAGGYAALALARVQEVVARRSRMLVAGALAAVVVAEAVYWIQLRQWGDPRRATEVLQPAMVLTSVAAMVALYVAGSRWASGRRPGAALVTRASDISFGVYLAHPLVLQVLLDHGLGGAHPVVPAPVASVLAAAGCTAGAAVVSLAARRTPLSLALTGRRAVPRPLAVVPRPAVAGCAMTAVGDLLAAHAARAPERIAFVEGRSGRVLTWCDVWEATSRLGERWATTGQRAVGLRLEDPLDAVTACLAGLAAGVTMVPLDPGAPAVESAAQARRLGASSMLTGLDDEAGIGPSAPSAGAALVMTSSGTTGAPKVVPLTERQLLHTARSVVGHHRITADDRGYSPLPLFHINALVVGVLSTVVAGSSLVVDRRFSLRSFWATADDHLVTWVNLVPAIIGLLAEAPTPPDVVVERVRFARSASAPLAPATLARFEHRCGITVLETYGMTEAASQITANPLDRRLRRPGSVGRSVGVELRVVDEAGAPVGPGTVGEIEIRGESVSAPMGSFLRTGDLGRVDVDGFVHLAGRTDDVINRGGEKVHPREIEDVLLADRRVASAIVVGRPDAVVGELPVAFVVAHPAAVASGEAAATLTADLARRCQRALSPFKCPARITLARSLPAGPTGKVRRAELRRLAGAGLVDALFGGDHAGPEPQLSAD